MYEYTVHVNMATIPQDLAWGRKAQRLRVTDELLVSHTGYDDLLLHMCTLFATTCDVRGTTATTASCFFIASSRQISLSLTPTFDLHGASLHHISHFNSVGQDSKRLLARRIVFLSPCFRPFQSLKLQALAFQMIEFNIHKSRPCPQCPCFERVGYFKD